MIAYPEKELLNGDVIAQAREEFSNSKISPESFEKIKQAYPSKLYTPNLFIAIALGLLTILAFSFTTFLFGLLASINISSGFVVLSIFMTVLSYISLEWMVKEKMYFNAGVDNALMVLVLSFIAGIFLSYFENPSWILMNGVLMLASLWLSIRFVDAFMAIVSATFFFVLCFLCFLKSGGNSMIYFSLMMILIIGGMYILLNKIKKPINFIYEKCINALTIFLLTAFYAVGNFWVINELQLSTFRQSIHGFFSWTSWAFTFAIPVLYIFYVVVKKDILHIRTGIVLVMMMVLTYKYYFTILPVEMEMLIAGTLLIVLCYFLIKWLRPDRYGFTSEMISAKPAWRNMEALVIAETMGGTDAPQKDNLFSGGSSGGGGASGEF
ncbi:MAG: hypothetical protein ABIY35_05380 [Chitinophagaceae bacterium]